MHARRYSGNPGVFQSWINGAVVVSTWGKLCVCHSWPQVLVLLPSKETVFLRRPDKNTGSVHLQCLFFFFSSRCLEFSLIYALVEVRDGVVRFSSAVLAVLGLQVWKLQPQERPSRGSRRSSSGLGVGAGRAVIPDLQLIASSSDSALLYSRAVLMH